MSENILPRLILAPGRDRRQQHGHPWVYDGEIAEVIGVPAEGAVVDCYNHKKVFVGRGYFNGRSKIRMRILTRKQDEAVDEAFLRQRLSWALARRQQLYPQTRTLRLVHAEGDGLPGLTIDRYEDVLVMQCASLGFDVQQSLLVRLLQELTGVERVYLRNDLSARRNDGLELYTAFYGPAFPSTVQVHEHGLIFEVDIATGHKTGFYLDQADNHRAVYNLVPSGGRILDAFCYTGAFAVHATAAGADEVVGLDSSAAAVAQAQRHAALNQQEKRCQFLEVNVFDHLRRLQQQGQFFDMVILDPPSFTRHRDAVGQAVSGYKEINLRALKLLRPGGILLTFTCSYYVDRARFETVVFEAGSDAKRQLFVRQRLSQALHHPEVLAIPETSYLKGLAVEVW